MPASTIRQKITTLLFMVEVQHHGFTFEKWVRDTFFGGYNGKYMQKWDIPPEKNKSEDVPSSYRNLPVSVKATKYGSPIGLGDARRQRLINHPFVMIVGFWRQRTPTEKWFEEIGVAKIPIAAWNSLWGTLTIEQISLIDSKIKDLSLPYATARLDAQQWKHDYVSRSGVELVINPKIDSKRQRRIQCSLPFSTFWRFVSRNPLPSDTPNLFMVPFKNPVISGSRTFKQD
jgi:hypothetical protein